MTMVAGKNFKYWFNKFNQYDIDLDLNRVYEYEVDKMIKEIEKNIGG